MNRLIFLDYLRVFAFLSVLIGHKYTSVLDSISENQDVHTTIRDLIFFLKPLYVGGGAGVIVFFLVSGYIILKVALLEKSSEFILKRLFRIYPVYIFAIVIQLILEKYVNQLSMPPFTEIVSRILLVGDVFGTPLALGGVEWTLRIEVFFYLFIYAISVTKIINSDRFTLVVMMILTFLVQILGPFPQGTGLNHGYFTLYFPFLFFGSAIYLYEKSVEIRPYCVALCFYILASYLIILPSVNKSFIGSNFLVCGIALFMVCYFVRDRLPRYGFVTFLSGLTYTVYLFHNWIWDYIGVFLVGFIGSPTIVNCTVPFLLFLICYVAHKTVELPGIKLGNWFINRYLK